MDGEAKFQLEVIEIKLKLFSREVYELLALRVPPPPPYHGAQVNHLWSKCSNRTGTFRDSILDGREAVCLDSEELGVLFNLPELQFPHVQEETL